ncbi:hypothetical protein O6H91_09G122900 [Diphasiastrum complanatum]|uniref:Uncharacterized protein n=1 Tax=Diphasiastrum complanatum TaxID=34168 RepID=A0ACC2CTX5_DIPCM|nr:hypothetical protein O6H91_09G122900 [Diphasiastrum complanatum]
MANRIKEEERHEKIIRNLLKQSGNKRCINCGSLGPQYVCTTFSIFICTACSGVHREFTHRVKSVSMAKFTAVEVAELQAGANERARMIYFKEWDPHRNPLPDNSNPDKLRSFIKNVYEEKRYTGEKSAARGRQNDREELDYPKRYESRSNNRSIPQSPPYEDQYEDKLVSNRPGVRNRDLGQSNGYRYNEEDAQFDVRKSPGRYERDRGKLDRTQYEDKQYDEKSRRDERGRWHDERDRQYDDRDSQHTERDRYSNGLDRRFEDRFSSHEAQEGRKSDANYKEHEERKPHIAYVKENHRNSASSLQLADHNQQNARQKKGFPRLVLAPVGSSRPSFGSSDTGQTSNTVATITTLNRADSFSLIDFSAEPEIPAATISADPLGLASSQPTADASSDGGWAKFDTSATVEVQPMTASSNSLDDFFASTNVGGQRVGISAPSITTSVPVADNWASFGGQMQPLPFSAPFPELNFPQVSSITSQPGQQQVQFAQKEKKAVSNGSTNLHQLEKRQPIPEDLFFSPISNSAQPTILNFGIQNGFQTSELPPLGVSPQITLPPYSQLSTSMNPFDLPGDSQSVAHGMFPSLGSLQTALPSALSADETSIFSTTKGIGNLPAAQMPYLAAVPPPASHPQAFGELIHPTMQDSHLKDNGTGFAANFGFFPAQNFYSHSSLPATANNPFG